MINKLAHWIRHAKYGVKWANPYIGDIEQEHQNSDYSSVGRAPDCRSIVVIGRSLVRIRVIGGFLMLFSFTESKSNS